MPRAPRATEPVPSVSTHRPSTSVGAAATVAGTRSSHGSAASASPTAAHASTTDAGRRGDRERRGSIAVADADQGAPRRPGIAVQVGGERLADHERRVERLAVGGERQDHRPATRARPAEPRAAHLDAVLAGVAAPGDDPEVGLRDTGQDVCLAHLPATRRGDGIGQRAGQLRHAAAGAGEQVEHAELGEDDLVPVGPGADDAGEAAHAVGQRAGAGVDETGGELVPRGVAGEGRVGEAGADAVVEPALELDEAGDEALDALVALAVEVDRAARVSAARRRRRRQVP